MSNWSTKSMMAVLVIGAMMQTACAKPATQETTDHHPSPAISAEQAAAEEKAEKAEAAAEEKAKAEAEKAEAIKAQEENADESLAKADDKSGNKAKEDNNVSDKYRGLTPFKDVSAPEITEYTTISFKTDAGELVIEVYPQAAPNAAKRFVELVEAGFYNNTPIFRIVPGFVAQFGINWRDGHKQWQNKNFKDDPSLFELGPGTLAFAKAGPDTNSTQVFINYGENSPLREQGGFSTFGRIISGYDKTLNFRAVGNPSMGLDQGRLWNDGEKYLKSLGANQPNMIIEAKVIK